METSAGSVSDRCVSRDTEPGPVVEQSESPTKQSSVCVDRESRGAWRAALLIAAVAALTYANSLGNDFLLDDFWHLHKAAHTSWGEVLQPWQYSGEDFKAYWFNSQRLHDVRGEGFFRPIVTTLYKLAGAAFGLEAWGYHAINILFHILASVAAFIIARLFFERRWVAVVVGLIFAVHPSHAETVQWVAANADAVIGCFFLASFAAFGWWLRQRRLWQYAAALLTFALALCSKEAAIMLPAVILVYEFCRARAAGERRPRLSELAARHAAFWIIALGYLALRLRTFAGISAIHEGGQYIHNPFSPEFVPFVLFNLTYELLHLAVPFPLFPISPAELVQTAGGWPVTLVCAAVLAGIGWLTRRLLGGARGWSFFLLFTALTLAPTFPILVAQRFLYVPSLGFCLMLGALLERLQSKIQSRVRETCEANPKSKIVPRWFFGAVAGLLAGYALVTVFLNFMWGYPSNLVRRQIAAIQREVPSPPRGGSLYLLNLWPPALNMEFMLPLLYQDPTLDVQVLTIHPKILPLDAEKPPGALVSFFGKCLPDHIGVTRTEARWEGADTLRVRIEGGRFMRSLIEDIYPSAAAIQKTGARVEMPRFTAEVTRADDGGVQELVFRFRHGGERPVVLDLRNGRVARVP